MLLSPGERLDDRYRVQKLLGSGATGEVWAGQGPNGPVAIKVLLERVARRTDVRKRFEREAQSAQRINSPFVCPLLDRGITCDGSLFLAFELLRGESLADRLNRERFLAFDELAPQMSDVLEGIADAHKAGVLHRDLKPGNIFLKQSQQGEHAIILDFGLCKVMRDTRSVQEPSLTAINTTVGSLAHIAPEQIRGAAHVDERADLYAMASVAFRALTGCLPFDATSAQMIASLKLEKPPPTLEQATGMRWPRFLEEFFATGLARTPDHRFASAQQAAAHWTEARTIMSRVRSHT